MFSKTFFALLLLLNFFLHLASAAALAPVVPRSDSSALDPRSGGNGDPGYCNILLISSLTTLPNFCIDGHGHTLSACACLEKYEDGGCTDSIYSGLVCKSIIASLC